MGRGDPGDAGKIARCNDFEDARWRPLDELRALLRDGDGPERVWAAWCLGLRMGGGVPAHLLEVRGDPDPGVRRHLAVMLAGAGEWDALVRIALEDPDEDVRGSTARLVARLAPGRPGAGEILRALLAPEACAPVVLAMAQEVPEVFAAELVEPFAGHAASRDAETRHAVMGWLSSHPDLLTRMPDRALALLDGEESGPVRRRLAEIWLSTTAAAEVLAQAARMRERPKRSVLDTAIARGMRFSAAELLPFGDGGGEIGERVATLLADTSAPESRALLLGLFDHELIDGHMPSDRSVGGPKPVLYERLRDAVRANRTPLSPVEAGVRDRVRSRLAWYSGLPDPVRDPDDRDPDDDEPFDEQWVQFFVYLRELSELLS